MTKICYIAPLAIHSARWIDALAKRGYEISLIADSKTWHAPTQESTRVFTIPMLNRQNLGKRAVPNLLRIMKILRTIKPDIINLHVRHYYSPAILLSHCPYVLTSWGLEVLELPNADLLTKNLAKMTALFAHKIIVDARCLKEIWMSLGAPSNKVEVIPFGVNLDIFKPEKNQDFVRKKLQLRQSDTVVISTRPFVNGHYNLECLIKAIPLVVGRYENVKFILKGTGPLEAFIKELSDRLKISKYVRFVGLTSHNEVAHYLAASDIYVSTSFLDSTSVSLLEAMASGLPPITTDIAGNREWVENGRNGLLYPPRNHVALASNIVRLIENKRERKLYGKRCLEIVRQKANWEKCVTRIETVYQGLL